MKRNNNERVSIITPVYNCELLIEETMKSVINQTYLNWEMLLVDDCSTDNSANIIKEYSKRDNRIKYFKLSKNMGAAAARNEALKNATGRFIAYLDSDDLWKKTKLEKQVEFMKRKKIAFSCTDYEKINENGESLNKIIKIPYKVNYNYYLKNTIIQTVGVMIDSKITGKDLLVMPNIRRRQDAATWCQLLKAGYDCYALSENLSYYRVVNNSLSSNKFKAVKGTWFLYRKIEKLSLLKSCFCFIGYAFNAIKKRIYIRRCVVNKNKKTKVLYIATTADSRSRLDGETVKCKLLRQYLKENVELIVRNVDTDDWKMHVLRLICKIIFNYFWCKKIVISSADRGANIVISFFNKIKSKKEIYYFVIGGSLYNNITNKKWNINAYKRLNKIYVEADILKKNLNELDINNVELLNNFRKVKKFEDNYEKSEKIRFVFYGRVIKEKGIEEAINLIKRLNLEGYNCSLDIYGQISQEYLNKIKDNFDYSIDYYGEIKPDNKLEYEILSKYDVFVLPTEYPGECLPGALVDAYIAGLAVLVSNWKYAREYVNDKENGLIFEYKNYNDMYIKAKELIDKNLISKFKANSKIMSKTYMIEDLLKDFSKDIVK